MMTLYEERVADGHAMPVHRHDGEKTGTQLSQRGRKRYIWSTHLAKEMALLAENMHEHLGHSRGGVAHVQHGEDTDEEVHGRVEACVLVDEGDMRRLLLTRISR